MKAVYTIKIFFSLILSGLVIVIYGQSDYEIVQSYKIKWQEISTQIENADSLTELNSAVSRIDELEQEYLIYKVLLDKSLYPDDFSKSLEKLKGQYLLRQGDFTTIDILQTEVVALSRQVEFLNQRNNELIASIQRLEAITNKDKKTIARIENLVEDLRANIFKRDRMVIEMVDSLMPPLMREKPALTDEDRQEILSGEERENVLNNVKRTISDNTKFLEVTSLKPKDITEVRKQQDEFSKTWSNIGIKLIEVYAGNEQKSRELRIIDSLFIRWYRAVDREAWISIREEFEDNKIQLQRFMNAEEFTGVASSFINDEIHSIGLKSNEESEKTYSNFVDSTWFAVVKPNWIPYLLDRKMITDVQKVEIENKIMEWKNELYPSNWWIYLIIAFLVIGVAGFTVIKRKSKSEVEDLTDE